MPDYKLTYFDIRGFGEPIRQLFHLANTPFEDIRLPFQDQLPGKQTPQWLEIKKALPFGRLPVLTVDGLDIPQSAAISRYLAKKFGFAGKTPEEEAWVDAIVDQSKDFAEQFRALIYATKLEFPEAEIQKIREETFIPGRDLWFSILARRLTSNPSGFLVGNGLTWADLSVADNLYTLEGWGLLGKEHGELIEYRKRIYALPELREHIEKRPECSV
uniref:glutathione transferase n=1 Tax=Caenorhabditis japonica TaxID=281687 RepID=A0A8R1DYD8_CAEJA